MICGKNWNGDAIAPFSSSGLSTYSSTFYQEPVHLTNTIVLKIFL